MAIRPEALPFIGGVVLIFGLMALILRARAASARRIVWTCVLPAVIGVVYMMYFFRDPDRTPPSRR